MNKLFLLIYIILISLSSYAEVSFSTAKWGPVSKCFNDNSNDIAMSMNIIKCGSDSCYHRFTFKDADLVQYIGKELKITPNNNNELILEGLFYYHEYLDQITGSTIDDTVVMFGYSSRKLQVWNNHSGGDINWTFNNCE